MGLLKYRRAASAKKLHMNISLFEVFKLMNERERERVREMVKKTKVPALCNLCMCVLEHQTC